MSDNAGTEQAGESPVIQQLRQQIKTLEEAAKTAAPTAELTQLQQENVLLRNGIDLDSPLTGLFRKGYDGEWTPDAVKAAAETYGLPVKGAAQPQADAAAQAAAQQQAQDAAGFAALDGAAAGGTDVPASTIDYSKANSPEEVMEMARKAGADRVVDSMY